VGDFNQMVLLDAIRRAPEGLSQVQLIATSGLSAQTVSNITKRLIDSELIRTDGIRINGRGKPRTTLRLKADGRYAVGIHLDPAVVSCVVTDLMGDVIIERHDVDLLTDDPESSMHRLGDAVKELIVGSGVDRARIVGVGIASPGPLNIEAGSLVDPPWLPGWDGVALRASLARELELPVLLDKDTIAAATAEMWARPDHGDSVTLFVYVGTGIGSALMSSGEVMRGFSDNAGEIGHLVVMADGPLCDCGRRGCLGRASDLTALVAEAISLGVIPDPETDLTPHVVDLQMAILSRAATEGTPRARQLLDRASLAIAEAVRMLVGIHDARYVVIGGPFWSHLESVCLPKIREVLLAAPGGKGIEAIVESSLVGYNVGAIGAASLVLTSAFSAHTASLLIKA
jgi:predicted NBD/HSP70 family sugar kinase